MTDQYARIRDALAMGPTPGPWVQDCDGVSTADEIVAVAICCRSDAEAAFIAACDPDTIRELLAERDQLAADIEALRAEVERLQEIVRPKREDECLTLDHWRMRAYDLEANWSRCSHACAVEQTKREQAEARAERLAEAFSRANAALATLEQEAGRG